MATNTKKQILDNAREEGVNFIRLIFTGMTGTVKNVEIPTIQLEKALNNDMMFDGSSIEGFVRIQESDMYLYPDLDTWKVLPTIQNKAKIGQLICDVYNSKRRPFLGDPRSNLKKVIEELKDLGFGGLNLGPEVEFFLFKTDEKGKPTMEVNDNGGYFDLAPLDLGENCRRDIVIDLEKMGFEVEASHHEVAIGQHEIDFKYSNVVKACDDIQMFKLITKSNARKHNLYATFMPKPIAKINGSGMHCNISIFNNDGSNAFYDEFSDNEGLSDVAMQFIAGVLKHMKAITAIANPTVNSYKRLVPGYEAPTYIAWSHGNRSPLIRIPSARGNGTRIEVRSVDPSANPYLTMTAIIAAGIDGIENKLQAPNPVADNIFNMKKSTLVNRKIYELPENLSIALNELEKDNIILNALGEHTSSKFIETKRKEWYEYSTAVHNWELEKYMSLL